MPKKLVWRDHKNCMTTTTTTKCSSCICNKFSDPKIIIIKYSSKKIRRAKKSFLEKNLNGREYRRPSLFAVWLFEDQKTGERAICEGTNTVLHKFKPKKYSGFWYLRIVISQKRNHWEFYEQRWKLKKNRSHRDNKSIKN